MSTFTYEPSPHVPFRDVDAIERVRKIHGEALTKHPNPDFQIRLVPAGDVQTIWVADIVSRLKAAADEGRSAVMILPNPAPIYRHVAYWVNKLRIDCTGLRAFAMDEYADQDGRIAPPEWEFGFIHALRKYFWAELDEDLRPSVDHFIGPDNKNVDHYGQLIEDAGGAEICYSGPGWTGHLAFIEPDAPEFDAPLDEWRKMGTRIVTLSPYTLAQNSLHGSFGKSGNLAAVPPKAVTIGPAEVIAAKHRIDVHSLTIHGTTTTWQRLVSRLCLHGPVTPKVPTSIHQELRTDCYVSDVIAQPIEPDWNKGY